MRLPGGFREREWSMRALCDRVVRGGRGDRVRELSRGDVLERDGGERVRFMPGSVVFGCRIRIDNKLLLQRRLLRPERRRVHGVSGDFHIFAGQSDGDRLWMCRKYIYNRHSNSEHTMEMWSWSKSSM